MRHRNDRRVEIAVILSLLIAGPVAGSAQEPTTGAATASSTPVVELIDPGGADRRQLRYTPTAGLTQTLTMHLGMKMSMSSGQAEIPEQTIPRMEMVAAVTVDEVDDDGLIHYTMEITEMRTLPTEGADATVVEAIDSQLAGLLGARAGAIVSSRGVTLEASFDLAEDADPQLRQLLSSFEQSIESMSAPLPEEPVGVGASWKTATTVEQNGMTLLQSVVTELVGLSGSEFELAMELEQSAERQPLNPAGMPPGAEATLLSYSGSGEGTMRLDERWIVPLHSEVAMQIETAITLEMQGNRQEMHTDVSMVVELEGEPAGQ